MSPRGAAGRGGALEGGAAASRKTARTGAAGKLHFDMSGAQQLGYAVTGVEVIVYLKPSGSYGSSRPSAVSPCGYMR
jgi:hypothetical protein